MPMHTHSSLTPEQKKSIQTRAIGFMTYMASEQRAQDQEERIARVKFFQKELPLRLPELSEADVVNLIGQLWANRMWGNKSYHAQKIITENGMDKLRLQLGNLILSADPPTAYAAFLGTVKGFGPASTSEILTYVHPDQCGIWNRQAREGLKALGLTTRVNLSKYVLSEQEYRVFNILLREVGDELQVAGVQNVDLLLVDFFLFEVAQNDPQSAIGAASPTTTAIASTTVSFDHDEIRDLVAGVGASLGFDVSTEVKVAPGAKVDVVWRAKIANLGLVQYVFEVHKSGSIDSLILNLQKARSAHSVQKVIAVSDDKQLEQIKNECSGLPYEFQNTMRYWRASAVIETSQHLQSAMSVIAGLGLIDDKA